MARKGKYHKDTQSDKAFDRAKRKAGQRDVSEYVPNIASISTRITAHLKKVGEKRKEMGIEPEDTADV